MGWGWVQQPHALARYCQVAIRSVRLEPDIQSAGAGHLPVARRGRHDDGLDCQEISNASSSGSRRGSPL